MSTDLVEQPVGIRARVREAAAPIGNPIIHRAHLLPRLQELGEPGAYLRRARMHWRLRKRNFTMLGSRYGRNLSMLAETVEAEGVPGTLVDCGVWNGGSTMLLAMGAPSRDVWAFDSFEGLPSPGENDGERSTLHEGDCVGSEQVLKEGFREIGAEARLHVVKGWFDETLAASRDRIGSIAVLHVDADWYDPITLALETLYPLISPGGFVAVDDYRVWPGARRAVDEFRLNHQIQASLRAFHYWRKPTGAT